MPKPLAKGARKRKKSPAYSGANTENEASDSKSCPKKKKTIKRRNCFSGIEMCKQLASEVQRKKTLRAKTSSKNNVEPRLCGNGKPMPSLGELEAMYEESDGDENPPPQITPSTAPSTSERCETPEQKPLLPDTININSPETLKKLTSKVIDIISKTIVLDDDDDDSPPPPVIPQKKPKKSDTPYIVGCKDRPQVPWAPKSKFGVDNEKYGVDRNQPPDDEEEKKRKKRGKKANISKSIFNAKSDEIAERLKELETSPNSTPTNIQNNFFAPPSSPDSSSTVDYDYLKVTRNFSPLPSTSNDTNAFLENDRLFNQSLMVEPECLPEAITPPASPIVPQASPKAAQGSPDEVEIIEVPCETVVIDDTLPEVKVEKRRSTVLDTLDDCCIILEPEKRIKRISDDAKAEPSPKDDIYGSIDLTQTYDNEIYEINDDEIDDLIAENQVVLARSLKKNSIDSVTFVDPNVIVIENECKSQQPSTTLRSLSNDPTASVSPTNTLSSPPNGQNQTAFISQTSTSNCNDPIVLCHMESSLAADHTYNAVNTTASTQPSASNGIAEVVNNFFAQPPLNDSSLTTSVLDSNARRGTSTVDLTGSQETMLNRLSSWICSIESYLSGRSTQRRRRRTADVVAVDDCQQTASNNNVPEQINTMRNTFNNNQGANQHSDSSSQSGVIASNPTQTSPPLPSSNLTAPHNSPPRRGLGDCPICMDNLTNKAVASTICGHVFCMTCIKTAIRSNGKKCPTCRKTLKGVGYHQLFL